MVKVWIVDLGFNGNMVWVWVSNVFWCGMGYIRVVARFNFGDIVKQWCIGYFRLLRWRLGKVKITLNDVIVIHTIGSVGVRTRWLVSTHIKICHCAAKKSAQHERRPLQ